MAVKFGHPKQHLETFFVLKVFKDERPSISFKTSPHLTLNWFEIKDITFFYKCKAGYYDLTLEDYILDNSTNHHTRFSSTDSYRPNRCRTSSFRNLFFNRIVPLWNSPARRNKILSLYSVNACFDVNMPRTWKTFCSKCRSCFMSCCS